MKLTLNLADLAVESFEANVEGDPTQWLMMPPPTRDDWDTECCDDLAAAPHVSTCTTFTR